MELSIENDTISSARIGRPYRYCPTVRKSKLQA
jgi:hypothetical protein